jgi:hypothetical protein
MDELPASDDGGGLADHVVHEPFLNLCRDGKVGSGVIPEHWRRRDRPRLRPRLLSTLSGSNSRVPVVGDPRRTHRDANGELSAAAMSARAALPAMISPTFRTGIGRNRRARTARESARWERVPGTCFDDATRHRLYRTALRTNSSTSARTASNDRRCTFRPPRTAPDLPSATRRAPLD